jgi:hypothetical protein
LGSAFQCSAQVVITSVRSATLVNRSRWASHLVIFGSRVRGQVVQDDVHG